MADTKISAATAVITPASTDEYATNQGGASKRTTRAQMHALVSGEHLVLPQVSEAATPTLAFGDGDSGFYEASDDNIVLAVAGAAVFSISSVGDVTVNTGNLVLGTAGKGIDFSNQASPAAGMTSELLDRYEEGTWTPTWAAESGDAPAIGNGTLTGSYIKIGRFVKARAVMLAGSTTTFGTAGNWRFSIPFPVETGVTGAASGLMGAAYISDTGTGWTTAVVRGSGVTPTLFDIALIVPGTIGTARVTSAAPMTWASTDYLIFELSYLATS